MLGEHYSTLNASNCKMGFEIAALNPMSAYGHGKGHPQTCIDLLRGMLAAGGNVKMYARRIMTDTGDLTTHTAIPRPLARFHHPVVERYAIKRIQRQYLRDLLPETLCWLWPTTDIETFRRIAQRGNPIIMEGINTRMSAARRILDEAYDKEGLAPKHGITDDRIFEEDEMLGLATHFFAPSPMVETALLEVGSPFRGHLISTSYGTWAPCDTEVVEAHERSAQREKPKFIFVGTLCIRKGTHHLLRAWSLASPNATLHLYGHVQTEIAQLCAAELKRSDVFAHGVTVDIASVYRNADAFIMPSLEEGGPQVTPEAAGYGLPLLTSMAGAGRMADYPGTAWIVDTTDKETFASAISEVCRNRELRIEMGLKARAASQMFDWNAVGARRLHDLKAILQEN